MQLSHFRRYGKKWLLIHNSQLSCHACHVCQEGSPALSRYVFIVTSVFFEMCATVAASNLGVPKKRRGGGGVPGAPEPYIFYHGAQIISLPIARALIILAWIPKCYRALEL